MYLPRAKMTITRNNERAVRMNDGFRTPRSVAFELHGRNHREYPRTCGIDIRASIPTQLRRNRETSISIEATRFRNQYSMGLDRAILNGGFHGHCLPLLEHKHRFRF